jgi:hypothetical protein
VFSGEHNGSQISRYGRRALLPTKAGTPWYSPICVRASLVAVCVEPNFTQFLPSTLIVASLVQDCRQARLGFFLNR